MSEQRPESGLSDHLSIFDNMINGLAYCEMIFDGDIPIDFRYISVNTAFEVQTGLKNVVGKKVTEVIPGIRETSADLFAIYGKVASTGISKKFEFYVEPLKMWFEVAAYCPQKGYFVAMFDVITERKLAIKSLREANERLDLTLNSFGAGLWDWNVLTGQIEWSDKMFELFGINRAESNASFESWRNVLHPDDAEKAEFLITQALDQRKALNSEYRIVLSNGATRWINAAGEASYDDNGNPIRMLGICVDITDRKLIQIYGDMSREILQMLNEPEDVYNLLQRVMSTIKSRTGFEAVGIRMQEGDDFPYLIQEGFDQDFLDAENSLVERDSSGRVCRDENGSPRLECTCGLVISRKTDDKNPCFTKNGSCWTNNEATEEWDDLRRNPRDRCLHEGYQSVAIIPIRDKEKVMGLLQLNDRRKGLLNLEIVEILEGLALHIGLALTRKLAEEELRDSAAMLRGSKIELEKAQQIAHIGSWKWHVPSDRLECSDEMYRIFGIDKNTFTGSLTEAIAKTIHPEDRARVEASNRAVRNGKTIPLEFRIVRSDGTERVAWAEGGALELDKNSRPTFLTGIVQDITERKNAEDEIKKSHSLLSNLACLVPGVIYQYRLYPDGSSAFPYSSPGMNDIYEVAPEEVREDATPVFGRLHPDDYDYVSECIRVSAETLQTFYCEFRVILPRQGLRWRWSQAHPEKMPDGSILWHGIISDITDRKTLEEAQQKLQEQEKHAVVGKVAGKMAHDFNNVLGIIMGTSELIQADDLPSEFKPDIDIILESAKKGRDLTKNLLFFAKDQEPKIIQFDLREKLDLVIRSLKSDLKDIEVNTSYGSRIDKILADAGLLENALINMLQNSIHALSKTKKPRLDIKAYAEDKDICIEIEDNGCGIPDEWKDKIFDPSVSLKGSGDRTGAYNANIKGSGYGMANVKRCIDKHGGTISFTSKVDAGTKFKITLPLIEGHLNNAEIETIQKQHAVGEKRILIVEDEPHYGRILYALLEKFNHNVALATDGKMALGHLQRNAYDAISLDYILPDMNGMDVYRKIRETNKDVPVIFVSGNFEFMQSMIDLKMSDPNVDYLTKPFHNIAYVNKIHEWLAPENQPASRLS